MAIISCLGSNPARLLESRQPSPGEVRKLLLALGMERDPYLIIADEPTNHLDLPSVICLEDALLETDCGLVLVSHDRRFLGKLANQRWNIQSHETGLLKLSKCGPEEEVSSGDRRSRKGF